MNKKAIALLMVFCSFVLLVSCTNRDSGEFWGSYTADKTYSHDNKYYALQTVEDNMIVVTVYDSETNKKIDSFSPARSMDFWGICWEKDSYNIWTQSADIGEYCFEYKNGKWVRHDEYMTPPDYIISRYDEKYRDNHEIWSNIYISPTK